MNSIIGNNMDYFQIEIKTSNVLQIQGLSLPLLHITNILGKICAIYCTAHNKLHSSNTFSSLDAQNWLNIQSTANTKRTQMRSMANWISDIGK